jgi:methylmalonyl-CoA/ethylmalonyl-CoA epimerase
VKIRKIHVREAAIERMEPATPESETGKFPSRMGEGLFPVSCKVDNVDKTLKELKDKEVQLIDEKPRHLFGNSYAFIHHPTKLFGTLMKVLDGDFDINAAL